MSSALAVMVALVLTSACSLLIADEADEVSCEQEGRVGPPACDPGFSCQAGVCRAASSPADGDGGQAGQQGQFAALGGGAGGALGEAGAAGAAERRP